MSARWAVAVGRSVLAAVLVAGLTAGSASAALINYATTLSGAAESPPNASPGTGNVVVTVDTLANTMRVKVTFSGLVANTIGAHIHCCTAAAGSGTAGVATTVPAFVGFPLGATAGTLDQTYDMTLPGSYNPAFVTANGGLANAMAALFGGLAAGKAYFNIHTTSFAGGEIRGFLALVPPATHFSVSGPDRATVGEAISITVLALDASNAVDPLYAGTVHFGSSDPLASLPADAMLTNGVGTFAVTLTTNGDQTITVTDTLDSSISGTLAVSVSAPVPTLGLAGYALLVTLCLGLAYLRLRSRSPAS